MVDITDQFASECWDVFYKAGGTVGGGTVAGMRAVLEYAFGHQEPLPVTSAAIMALAEELAAVRDQYGIFGVAKHVLDAGMIARLPATPDAEVTDAAVEALAEELCELWLGPGCSFKWPEAANKEAWRRVGRHVLSSRQAKPENRTAHTPAFESFRQLFWDNGIKGENGAKLARKVVEMGRGDGSTPSIDEDISDKPPMPAHDYADRWARDTLSGTVSGGRFTWGERNLARSYLALKDEPPAGTIRLGQGLTEAQETMPAGSKLVESERILEAANGLYSFGWALMGESRAGVQHFYDWLVRRAVALETSAITALRASADPKPEPVDWLKIAEATRAAGSHLIGYDKDAIITGLCEQLTALRSAAGGSV